MFLPFAFQFFVFLVKYSEIVLMDFAPALCLFFEPACSLGLRRRSGQLVSWNTVARCASLLAPELLVMEVEPSLCPIQSSLRI